MTGFNEYLKCVMCDGTGSYEGKWCFWCNGYGKLLHWEWWDSNMNQHGTVRKITQMDCLKHFEREEGFKTCEL